MPFIAQVAVGKRKELSVFGNDYDTVDGTGVRDYIHVVDLAIGHIKALEKIAHSGVYTYNLGSGQGTSVLELVTAFEKVNGVPVPYQVVDRRPGGRRLAMPTQTRLWLSFIGRQKRRLKTCVVIPGTWQSKNPNGFQE